MGARLLAFFLALMNLGQSTWTRYEQDMSLGGNLFLVNRSFVLASDYKPDDLVKPDVECVYDNTTLRREAAEALENMFSAAGQEGYILVAVSGFRSYGQQSSIFQRKVDAVGKKRALLTVAPPGASEHQLGLAMDLGTKKSLALTEAFGETKEGRWVQQHAHEFGFIIRYKEEWTDVTGYSYEPWHIRYVGKEHAERLYQMNIPLEEYIALLWQVQYDGLTAEDR